jgi:hypothetical protein
MASVFVLRDKQLQLICWVAASTTPPLPRSRCSINQSNWFFGVLFQQFHRRSRITRQVSPVNLISFCFNSSTASVFVLIDRFHQLIFFRFLQQQSCSNGINCASDFIGRFFNNSTAGFVWLYDKAPQLILWRFLQHFHCSYYAINWTTSTYLGQSSLSVWKDTSYWVLTIVSGSRINESLLFQFYTPKCSRKESQTFFRVF